MSTTIYEGVPAVPRLSSPAVSAAAADSSRVLVSCEDGSLSVFATSDDPYTSPRPAFAAVETIARFTKDRKPARGLLAVPRWRALHSFSGACARARDCTLAHAPSIQCDTFHTYTNAFSLSLRPRN